MRSITVFAALLFVAASCSDEPDPVTPDHNQFPTAETEIPMDECVGVDTSITFIWHGSDPDGDAITYSLYISKAYDPDWLTPRSIVVSDHADTTYHVTGLERQQRYFWAVSVLDCHSVVYTRTAEFTTR